MTATTPLLRMPTSKPSLVIWGGCRLRDLEDGEEVNGWLTWTWEGTRGGTGRIVIDPNDSEKMAGVYTYDHLFQQTDKVWNPGRLRLWDSSATADVTDALTSGQIEFKWNKIDRPAGSQAGELIGQGLKGGLAGDHLDRAEKLVIVLAHDVLAVWNRWVTIRR